MQPSSFTTTAVIGIFKTNICTFRERNLIVDAICNNFDVSSCHVDIEDCDKVLRVVDMKVDERSIISFVKQQGFHCEVLE